MLRQFDVQQCTKQLEKVYGMVLDADRRQAGPSDGVLLRWNPDSNSHGEAACSSSFH